MYVDTNVSPLVYPSYSNSETDYIRPVISVVKGTRRKSDTPLPEE